MPISASEWGTMFDRTLLSNQKLQDLKKVFRLMKKECGDDGKLIGATPSSWATDYSEICSWTRFGIGIVIKWAHC